MTDLVFIPKELLKYDIIFQEHFLSLKNHVSLYSAVVKEEKETTM